MIVCIIQARMGSTRLPGKVLMPVLGKPMLLRQIERVRRSRLIDKIIIATTVKKEDDEIETMVKNAGFDCFRGSENDVLDRYYRAAQKAKADIVIRLTGDCPLSDPKIIDETIEYFLQHKKSIDYTSKPINYPEGLDMEIFSFSVLERAWKEGIKPSEREHVTPYIYNHPEIFQIRSWKNGTGDFSKMHWSVDTIEDFKFVTKIFEALYHQNPNFSKDEIIKFLQKNPSMLSINSGGTGYEGYIKSLQEDKEFQKKRKIYEKIVGFAPEAIAILSGGAVKVVNKKGEIIYHSTKIDEEDTFGILWGEARVIASAELSKYFPKAIIIATSAGVQGEQSHAEIMAGELEKLSVDSERIILEKISTNTLSQIGEIIKIIHKNNFRTIAIVTNGYHLPRARALYDYFDTLSSVEAKTIKFAKEIKKKEVKVQFIAAESILPYRDKKFTLMIKQMKKSLGYKKRVKNEIKGISMIESGEYGKSKTKEEDKIERKIS